MIGVFKYDLFPYMVTHNVKSVKPGNIVDCDCFSLSLNSMIYLYNTKRGSKAAKAIASALQQYKQEHKELKSRILDDLCKEYPELMEAK